MGFSDYLLAAPFVVFFFGFCIFIHELGHFLAAKWRGLHIVAFSIGFKKVWGFKYKGVDYRIGCIPCGGYVDLPQIDATGEPTDENGNPLPPAKPLDKIITAFAGPLFNILFGVLLSIVVWYYGIPQGTPRMSEIKVASIDVFSPEYNAGLREGDVITAMNGKPFNCTWNDFARKFIFAVGKVTLDVKRGDKNLKITYQPAPNAKRTPREKVPYPFFLPVVPVKCVVEPGTPVAKAGMRTGDVIVAVNGKNIAQISEFETLLAENNGSPITLTVLRDGKRLTFDSIKPRAVRTGIYRIGVGMDESLVSMISDIAPPTGPTTGEKLKVGDRILRVDGEVPTSPMALGEKIEKAKNKPMKLLLLRNGRRIEVTEVFPTPDRKLERVGNIAVKYKRSRTIWFPQVFPDTPAARAGVRPFDEWRRSTG